MLDPPDPEAIAAQALILETAPAHRRAALRALLALDGRLGWIARTTREPIVGQMRLTWWHDALNRLDSGPAPAEPLLGDVQAHLLPRGVPGAALATMTDGWEELIVADPLDAAAMERYAVARGGGVFALAGRVLGGDSPLLVPAGRAWAFADLVANLSDRTQMELATGLADAAFTTAFSVPWPRPLRAIGMLSLVANLDRAAGSPVVKALRVSRFRLTGR